MVVCAYNSSPGGMRQEDCHESEANLRYIVRHCLKNNTTIKNPNNKAASLAGSAHPSHRPGARGLECSSLQPNHLSGGSYRLLAQPTLGELLHGLGCPLALEHGVWIRDQGTV